MLPCFVALLLPCFAASLGAVQALDLTASCSGVAQSRLAARGLRCLVNSLSRRFSFLREFVASVFTCFVDALLRCFVASLRGPWLHRRCFVASSRHCFVALWLPCFAASLLRCCFACRGYIGITIRICYSKSLFEVTGLGDAELCSIPLSSTLLRAFVCTGSR